MIEDSELSALVFNVLNENRHSHCRLCLKIIQDQYVRFHDSISLYPESGDFQTLSEILIKLFGDGMCEEIVGIDAVCMLCIDKLLESYKFQQMCEKSNNTLNNVFNNLANKLNIDIDAHARKTLYIEVSENESQLIFTKQKAKKKVSDTKEFQCTQCDELFHDMLELRVHNVTSHASYKTKQMNHERTQYIYQCPECNDYSCSAESLKKHQELAHGEFVCKDCGKPCKGMEKLLLHEQKHISKSECPKCGKTYNTKGFFLKHVKLCLEDRLDPHPIRSKIKKTYFCDKCGKGYSTPGGLRVHNRFVHGNAKPHVCKYCSKQFTAPSYLKVHMLKHTGEKNFKCDLCSRHFVSKEALLYHTRRHTGDKPYSCTLCDEKFVNASARAEHIKFKHVGPTLMCEICSRKFFTPNFLKQHIKKHHDPSNKLYAGRSLIPPNVPGVENMRVRFID